MLAKCLNPQCTAKFRYLGEGRLFRIDFAEIKRRRTALPGGPVLCAAEHASEPEPVFNPSTATAGALGTPDSNPSTAAAGGLRTTDLPGATEKERPSEHFWLCTDCASSLTIAVSDAGEVMLVKLPAPESASPEPLGPNLVAAS